IEVVKIDGKGRITIPSYARLILDISEGSSVVMNVDEDRKVIEIRTLRDKAIDCLGIITKDDLIRLINKTDIISIKCICVDVQNCSLYRCSILMKNSNNVIQAIDNFTKSVNCTEV
ncbi:MAG: AbrB/MazE/SpoVT family DNA-binding domain-containing protein, partial [Ignisphaera sp.]